MSNDENNLDPDKIIKRYALMNPHIALSDIAFMMGVPYKSEPGEYKITAAIENIETAEPTSGY
jgi:hypothetical protein